MKRIISFLCVLFTVACYAQETVEVKNRLTDSVIERYHVIKMENKTDRRVKQGLYQAFFRRRTPVASGMFTNDVKTGVWHFFNTDGLLIENYDYGTKTLLYEAHEDTGSYLRYLVDRKLTDTDSTTKPVKIGGRYYGYLPYLEAFIFPYDSSDVNTNLFDVQIQLLISPLGRLAEYKIRVVSKQYQYDRTTTMSLSLFKEEDKQFIPATVNNVPVVCRIMIRCYLTPDGEINFD